MFIKANFIRSSNFLVLILLLCIPIFICYSQEVDKEISELEHNIQTRENINDADDVAVKDSQIQPLEDLDKSINNLTTAIKILNRYSNWNGENIEKMRKAGVNTVSVTKGDLATLRKDGGGWEWGAIALPNTITRLKAVVLKQNMIIARCNLEKKQLEDRAIKSIDLDNAKIAYKEAVQKYWLFLKTAHWMD